ncbi:MFS transporter [Blastococcus deserti]|uniref:MFS transporter n=1 Tax=Blastococcus deserti TaxID=2259033 RepID=A0ABW4XHF5_9ACTN
MEADPSPTGAVGQGGVARALPCPARRTTPTARRDAAVGGSPRRRASDDERAGRAPRAGPGGGTGGDRPVDGRSQARDGGASTGCAAREVGWSGPPPRGWWRTSRSARSSAGVSWPCRRWPTSARPPAPLRRCSPRRSPYSPSRCSAWGEGCGGWAPRRLLGLAAAGAGAGLGMAASWDRPLALWIGVALLFGTASGLAYGVSVALAARLAPARRGAVTGVVVAAFAAGPVLLGVLGPRMVPVLGWRACVAGLALVVVCLLAGAVALVPDDWGDRADRGDQGDRSDPPPAPGSVDRRTVVPLWVLFAGGSAPGLFVFASAAPLAAERGLGPAAAGSAVSLLAAGNLGGRLVAGWWSDRVGRRPALAAALAVAAASVAGLAGPRAPWLVLSAFAGTGLAYGAVSALVPAATADRVGARAFPRAYGRVFTAWGCAGLLAPVVGGALTAGGQCAQVVLVVAVPLIPALLALLLLAPPPLGQA